jgi:hypothetical protein
MPRAHSSFTENLAVGKEWMCCDLGRRSNHPCLHVAAWRKLESRGEDESSF